MALRFHPLPNSKVQALRSGAPDANGLPAERAVSGGKGFPCRSCLGIVPEGAEILVFAVRPFGAPQPYAETGPAFLCADDCTAFTGTGVPPILRASPTYLLKGYGQNDRIVYGTGRITPADEVQSYAEGLLSRDDIAYVDVRSATNNCWLTRIRPAEEASHDQNTP